MFYYYYYFYCALTGIAFTQWSKNGFFAPQGRHIAPKNVKFGTLSKFGIFLTNFPLVGDSFA